MLVVLDTSLLVAAWRSRSGASFEVLRLLRDGEFDIAVSVPLVVEYESALVRHLSGEQTVDDVGAVVDYLCLVARKQEVFFLWRPLLRDPNDDMVAELAVASGARSIVTHNLGDFAGVERFGVSVLAPSGFLRHLLRRQSE